MRQARRDYLSGRGPFQRSQSIKHFIALWFVLLLTWGGLNASSVIMPLEQVKPGMKGIGKSAFLGNRVDEFQVEILGILENVQPKKNIILARLSGQGLENTGIIQGMSGSPVYIDGKIIGAVAFSFAFAKEPIAGITPIEEMLAISGESVQTKPPAGEALPIRSSLTLDDLAALRKDFFSSRQPVFSQEQALLPIGVPMVFGGFTPTAVERANPLFRRLGFYPILSGASGQAARKETAWLLSSSAEMSASAPSGLQPMWTETESWLSVIPCIISVLWTISWPKRMLWPSCQAWKPPLSWPRLVPPSDDFRRTGPPVSWVMREKWPS
jgi:hypothetical protein